MRDSAQSSWGVRGTARTVVPATLLAIVVWTAPARSAPPPTAGCKSAFPAANSSCIKDAQCCSGLVCQNRACRLGCRIGDTFYAPGAVNPANQCQTCQPATTVSAFTNRANGTSCNDQNACTLTDTCQAGVCTGSSPVVCSASDQCHVAGTCDPATGSCSNPAKANGTVCNDGNACTTVDTCQGGACTGASPVVCSALDQCHVAGTCDPTTGSCSNPAKPNGTACNDGNACTTVDTCQAGACTGASPVVCSALDQCHDPGTCDLATGTCSNPAKADGTSCDDGSACTRGDRCLGGSCLGAALTICVARDQCHDAGTCDPQTGNCPNPSKADGTACNDGSNCTGGDSCQSGVCTGSPVLCEFPGPCQNAGSCDPATGQCAYPPKVDGTSCSDGNACTVGDTCQGGSCVSSPIVCPIFLPTQCTTPAADCNPSNGQCVARYVKDGTACDDDNACTTEDSCQQGVCTGDPCPPGHACCSTDAPCADLGFDPSNCGSCGHDCGGLACLRGECYDGCVIDHVGYPHGASPPGNQCLVCDTSKSRGLWTELNSLLGGSPVFCSVGCFSGVCNSGACTPSGPIGAGGQCAATSPCSVGICNAVGVCVQTAVNEGGACIPPLSTSACKSGSEGTCSNGTCVAANANEGGYCAVETFVGSDDQDCYSRVDGTCAAGACQPNKLPAGTACCIPGTLCSCATCSVNGRCGERPDGTLSTPTKQCSVRSYCGDRGECNDTTGLCEYPAPFDDQHWDCSNVDLSPNPGACCPDQICICAPTPTGIPQFCIFHQCWRPDEIPDPRL